VPQPHTGLQQEERNEWRSVICATDRSIGGWHWKTTFHTQKLTINVSSRVKTPGNFKTCIQDRASSVLRLGYDLNPTLHL